MAGTLVGFFEEVRGECRCGAQRFNVVLHDMREDPLAAMGPDLFDEREDVLLTRRVGGDEEEEQRLEAVAALDCLFEQLVVLELDPDRILGLGASINLSDKESGAAVVLEIEGPAIGNLVGSFEIEPKRFGWQRRRFGMIPDLFP